MLETIVPVRTAGDSCAVEVPALRTSEPEPAAGAVTEAFIPVQMTGMTAVSSRRAAFSSAYAASTLFDDSNEINVAGLSLNVICQSYPGHQLKRLLEYGTRVGCLFIDPNPCVGGGKRATRTARSSRCAGSSSAC
ncbi:hypothetical protein GCM10022248_87580 [Nonomuraea soli]